MARRYSRDNRGRFASAGTGATARGGRLRTAAGNKRATVTAKVAGGNPAGTMKGKVKRDAGAAGKIGQGKAATPSKKRVLVRMDARPQNLFSRTTKKSDGYGTDPKANVANARKQIEKAGATSALKSNKRSSTVASVNEKSPKQVDINASHTAWRNPRKGMIQNRRKNEFSTSSPGHYVAHELGHVRHPSGKMARSWDVQLRGKGQVYADSDKVISAKIMARRVSKYAMTQPAEFAAETRAARSLGKKYDSKVMGLYRNVTGTKLPSLKSQQQKKSASSGYVSPRAKPKSKPAAAAPKPAAAKGARLGGTRRTTQAAAPKNTTPNKTGQSKTLNKFNSRPVGTMVAGKGINLVPSTKRVPLQIQRKESDFAFARIATKAARKRAAAPAKAAARQTAANRPARALANQKRTAQAIVAKGGKRPTPTRKQKKSLAIADAARTFYSVNRVNSVPGFKVNTSKPGYRKPKPRS